jgi:hypothetical protein
MCCDAIVFLPINVRSVLACASLSCNCRGSPGAEVILEVNFQGGRKHLPIVTLKQAG